MASGDPPSQPTPASVGGPSHKLVADTVVGAVQEAAWRAVHTAFDPDYSLVDESPEIGD